MKGFVQQLLAERGQQVPIKVLGQKARWPVLEECLRLKILPYVDYALASALLKDNSMASEGEAALLCHLSFAARHGHLCVSIDNQVVEPDPRELWPVFEEEEAVAPQVEVEKVLDEVYSLLIEGVKKAESLEAVRRFRSLYYLQRYWEFEELFLRALRPLSQESPVLQVDSQKIKELAEEKKIDGTLLPEQAEAIVAAAACRLTLLTGGPGTGKTYTAGQMIQAIWQCLPSLSRPFEIALAAPTGKAAANLQASLMRTLGSLEGFPPIQASTLHGLLGIKNSFASYDIDKKLSADLILVDECSMIDAKVMAYLFAAVKPGARLIMLGDKDQLPSVDAGGLFHDIVDLMDRQNSPSLIKLDKCMRAENSELIVFAQAVKEGKGEEAAAQLQNVEAGTVVSRLMWEDDSLHRQLLSYAKPYLHALPEICDDPLQLLREFSKFKILTPLRRGPCGVEQINKLFAEAYGGICLPIMLMQNDHRLDLYNGEVGVLVRHPQGDCAYFQGRSVAEPCKKVAAVLLPAYEWAYCLSVHKSQGSEFGHVVMLVPPGTEVFGREIFYTAATRARKKLDIWGADEVITKTLDRCPRRLSGVLPKSVVQFTT